MRNKNLSISLVLLLTACSLLTGCRSLDVDSYVKEKPVAPGAQASTNTEKDTEPESETTPEKVLDPQEEVILEPVSITASSSLKPDGNTTYEPRNISDNDVTTAWAEAAEDDGAGQYLEFAFPSGTVITGGTIYPAYYKSDKVFKRNPGVNSMRVSSGGVSCVVDTSEGAEKYSKKYEGLNFTLSQPMVSDGKVKVEILEVRPGSKYHDLSISELHFRGFDLSGSEEEAAGDAGEDQQYEAEEITDQTMLSSIASGASNLMRRIYGDDLPSDAVKLKTGSLTSEEKSFLLYWYQYFDNTHFRTEEGEFHVADRETLETVMEGLLDGGAAKDCAYFLTSSYVEKVSEGDYYMSATGDFGDAGRFYFDNAISGGIEEGKLQVTGDVMTYNSKKGKYKATRKFTIYLIPDENGVFEGWKYQEIQVTKKK